MTIKSGIAGPVNIARGKKQISNVEILKKL